MRIVAFSDVHGNKYAMESFMAALRGVDYDLIFFLGDVFGYFYHPTEVLEMMRAIPSLVSLRGNHDKLAYDVVHGLVSAGGLVAKYGNSYAMLDGQVVDSLAGLPFSREIDCAGVRIGLFHGTPSSPRDGRLYPKDECTDAAPYAAYDVVIGGHTHFRMDRKIGSARVLGAGSIGQPRDFMRPCFLVYDTASAMAEYVEFEYDRDKLAADVDKYDPGNGKLMELVWRYRQ